MNRKRKSERSASHRQSIKSRRVYTNAEIQERIDRNNFRRGHLSTSGYSTLRNCSHRSTSSGSNSAFSSLLLDHFSLPSQNSLSIQSRDAPASAIDIQLSNSHEDDKNNNRYGHAFGPLNTGRSQQSFPESAAASDSFSNAFSFDGATPAYNPLAAVEIANLDLIFRQEELSQHRSPVDGSQLEKNDFVLESVEAANLSIKECFDILDTGKIPSQPLFENQHIQKCQKEFLDKIYHQKQSQKFADPMFHCEVCKERWLTPTRKVRVSRSTSRRTSNGRGGQYQCQTCASQEKAKDVNNGTRLFSAENDMDPFNPIDLSFAARYEYLLLPKLNEISQMLIARVHTYMKVFRLQGGGTRYEGKHFVNLIQPH